MLIIHSKFLFQQGRGYKFSLKGPGLLTDHMPKAKGNRNISNITVLLIISSFYILLYIYNIYIQFHSSSNSQERVVKIVERERTTLKISVN